MGAKLNKDVQEAFRDLVMETGPDVLGPLMGMPIGTLYNKANVNDTSHHKPTLADAVLVTILTGDKRILHAFAAVAGEACYPLPDMSNCSTDSLLHHLLKIESEGGDFYNAIRRALADADRVTPERLRKIEKEAHEWISAILEGLHRIREMSS